MRKKHLHKNMVLKHPDRIFVRNRDHSEFFSWLSIQRRNRPLVIELGIGTGDFLISQAKKLPNQMFLGIEIKKDRIFKAFMKAHKYEIENIAYLQADIRNVMDYELGMVERIYILFPDPWPKKKHIKRRLSSDIFIHLYEQILGKHGDLIFKTDDQELFEFTSNQFHRHHWNIYNRNYEFITPEEEQTAYERKFREDGRRIGYLHVNRC